jgi:hypothetical protein
LSKFHGIVCVAGSASKEAMTALVSEQVSAFAMNVAMNVAMNKVDDGEWDWWELPAADGPSFAVKPEFVGDPRLVVAGDQAGRCVGGPVSAIDLDIPGVAAAEAEGAWQAWHATPGAASAVPLSDFLGRIKSADGYTAQKARADFAAQPSIREYLGPDRKIRQPYEDPVYRFRGTLDDYLEREAARLLRCEAFVTEAGDWLDASAFGGSMDDFSVFVWNHLRRASEDVSVMYLHFHS